MENKQIPQPQEELPQEQLPLSGPAPDVADAISAEPAEAMDTPEIPEPIVEEAVTAEVIAEEVITEEVITEEVITEEVITEEVITEEVTTAESLAEEVPAQDNSEIEAFLAEDPIFTDAEEDALQGMMEFSEETESFDFQEPAYDEGFRETAEDSEFENLFQAPVSQSVPTGEIKPRPPRKGRPKRKKGYGLLGIPHLIATAIWLAIIVSIGVSLGRMLWLCAADVLAFGRHDKSVSITIAAEDTIEDISTKLHNAGLVRYPGLFRLYASLAVDDGEIATGTFTLNTLYDYHAIVNGMSAYSSFRNVIEDVLIPEGYNCRQIFQLLAEKGICSVAELEAYAANGEFSDYWFLEGVQRGDKYCLEGFLFPDTYDFYEGSTPREALGKMLTAFEKRFTDEMRDQIATLNQRLAAKMKANGCSQSYIDEHLFSVYDVVIVASLIEEETANASESPKIASVIYNRLTQDQAHERYLGIDATILYALGEHKDTLTAEDLAIDSPYNTRTHSGLIPTPITNPGLNSLMAALDPADSAYYYYLLNPSTGSHTFSKTAAEHDALKKKYGY